MELAAAEVEMATVVEATNPRDSKPIEPDSERIHGEPDEENRSRKHQFPSVCLTRFYYIYLLICQ
jgi:hypothetical protein